MFTRKSTPTGDILRTIIENGYKRITYDVFSDTEYQYDINDGDDVYARKDSLFVN
jgi:hypothetical protein